MLANRRRFLIGTVALLAAPAIVKASNLMPVSDWSRLPLYWGDGIHDDTPYIQASLDALPPGGWLSFGGQKLFTMTPVDFSRCMYNYVDLRNCITSNFSVKVNLGRSNYINLARDRPNGSVTEPSL